MCWLNCFYTSFLFYVFDFLLLLLLLFFFQFFVSPSYSPVTSYLPNVLTSTFSYSSCPSSFTPFSFSWFLFCPLFFFYFASFFGSSSILPFLSCDVTLKFYTFHTMLDLKIFFLIKISLRSAFVSDENHQRSLRFSPVPLGN